MQHRTARRNATLFTTALCLAALLGACLERPVAVVQPRTQSGVVIEITQDGLDKVDLLLMVDNSNSMQNNQTNIMDQFQRMIRALTSPPCISDANPDPHDCNPADATDSPLYPAVKDLRVGVVDSDLGTPGVPPSLLGCANADYGDDGLLNPIRYGGALRQHEPWNASNGAPPNFRPADCNVADEFPQWISFASGDDAVKFEHDFRCNAGLYVNGCGLESQLESVWRALIWHGAGPVQVPGGDTANQGFLRDDALLAIVMLSDEDDGSVRNCAYALPGEACDDALDVYAHGTPRWAHDNPNLRFYMYRPGSAQDPTWPINRYIDPHDPSVGFLSLKPGHPERVLFAAITGVPIRLPGQMVGSQFRVDWNALLGAPSNVGVDDFTGRNAIGNPALDYDTPEGPTSMQQANQDPNCPERMVPSCRREGTVYPDPNDPTSCRSDVQYYAFPSRRIVEVARRFDQAKLCRGAPCANGVVTSICSSDFGPAVDAVVRKIQSRLQVPCLPRPLQTQTVTDPTDPSGATHLHQVDCVVREVLPAGAPQNCDPALGQSPALDPDGHPITETDPDGTVRTVCAISQVSTYAGDGAGAGHDGLPLAGSDGTPLPGWYYNTLPDPSAARCRQRISFTSAAAAPPNGSTTRLECLQRVDVPDGG